MSDDDPLWMVWFILRWSVAGMAACLAIMALVFRFWTPPYLVNVIIGGLFVMAAWVFGAWWTDRKESTKEES